LSSYEDGRLLVWDLVAGAAVRNLSGLDRPARSIALSPDGHTALAAAPGGALVLWDLETGKIARRLTPPAEAQHSAPPGAGLEEEGSWAVALSADGTRAFGLHGSEARAWDLASGELVADFECCDSAPHSIAASHDGQLVLLGMEDGRLVLLDLSGAGGRQELRGHTAAVTMVGFLPDRGRALSASADGTVRLWDLFEETSMAGGPTPSRQAAGDALSQELGALSRQALMAWIDENRQVPQLTCQQRLQYGVEPLCDGTSPLPAASE
jgi:WD40 repeat protein